MIAAVLMIVLAQVSSQPAPPPPRDRQPVTTGTAIVRGRVVAADTGAPIRGCNVILAPARPVANDEFEPVPMTLDDMPPSVQTDEDGRFQFTGLPPGRYRLSAWPDPANPRYLSPSGLGVWDIFGKPFDLAQGQKLEVSEIRLPRAGVLAGRVLDDFGEPIAQVQVSALMRMETGDTGQNQSDTTDDLGRFRLFGLTPGEYFVQAEPQDFREPGRKSPIRLLPTYLPSASTLAEAAAIRVAAGQEVGELEIRLISGRTFSVSGVIMTSKGQPFSRRIGEVMFAESRAGGGMSSKSVNLKDDGTFEVDGVRPGAYSIEIHPGFRHPDADVPEDAEYASVPIIVNGDDVDGVTVVSQPGVSVAGEVVFDEPPTADPSPFEITASTTGNPTMMYFYPSSRARVAPDGAFILKGLHRPVYIRVAPPDGYHLASIAFNGENITDTPMEFRAGVTGKLAVTLTRRASELSGEVYDAEKPASGVVIAFGEDRTLWTQHATTTKWTRSYEAGQYKLSGLRPGRYLVAALPLSSASSMMNLTTADQWESLAKQATPVTIGDDERKVLNLKLVSEIDR